MEEIYEQKLEPKHTKIVYTDEQKIELNQQFSNEFGRLPREDEVIGDFKIGRFINRLKQGQTPHIKERLEKIYGQKIEATKLTEYVDGVIVTQQLKYKLDIDYKNGIFIDDSIRDLEGLYKKGAAGVFRIIRKNGKNSNKKLNNTAIKEFISLEEIKDYLETETNKS